MFPTSKLRSVLMFALITASVLPSAYAGDKKTNSPCGKPPDVVSASQPTEEEQKKARNLRAQGSVNISISENGDVVEAKVVRASSPEAGELLLARAKSMKFKPRLGCGTFNTTVNYSLAGQ